MTQALWRPTLGDFPAFIGVGRQTQQFTKVPNLPQA